MIATIKNKIVFRVDSSFKIATGHVMRCLTLAEKLRKEKAEVVFICRDLEGNIIDRIEKENFVVKQLPKPSKKILFPKFFSYQDWLEVDWKEDAKQVKEILESLGKNITLIIDHYSINQNWQKSIRGNVAEIIVIDDLANRKLDCDIIINQNLYYDYQSSYDNLVPQNCQKFLGPSYAILREQFYQIKKRKRKEVKNILIFFGGIDPDNLTLKAVNASLEAEQKLSIKFNILVIGAKNKYQMQIKNICKENGFEYQAYIESMAKIMHGVDLSIGGGGSTTWERCYLNLPAIVISLADNQTKVCQALQNYGVIKYLGNSQNITQKTITASLIEVCNNFNFKMLDFPSKFKELIKNIL